MFDIRNNKQPNQIKQYKGKVKLNTITHTYNDTKCIVNEWIQSDDNV